MTIYIIDLESVETRYTKQWKEHLPRQLQSATSEEVVVISGGEVPQTTTPGAFLNFGGTNVYKSKQLEQIGELFCNGTIKDGDYFLYTDAWNPTVIQLKYMADLLNLNVKVGGLWHAGSYDPQDFLGRLIGNKPWVRHAEKSMFDCFDHNFFATEFHAKMYFEELLNGGYILENPWADEDWNELFESKKMQIVGWPMEYLEDTMAPYANMKKENIVLFPHRKAPEKQLEIFLDLKEQNPDFEFIVCQDKELTKDEYHSLLGRAKVVFSANLQETLGISWYEGVLANAIPMVPNRLSYAEMAIPTFKYSDWWSKSIDTYKTSRKSVSERLREYVIGYDSFKIDILAQKQALKKFFSGEALYRAISDGR